MKAIEAAYISYNKKYYHGDLPSCLVLWKSMREDEGSFWLVFSKGVKGKKGKLIGYEIRINKELKSHFRCALIVLLHEMAHLYLHTKGRTGHGKNFQKEITRLFLAGAYKGQL